MAASLKGRSLMRRFLILSCLLVILLASCSDLPAAAAVRQDDPATQPPESAVSATPTVLASLTPSPAPSETASPTPSPAPTDIPTFTPTPAEVGPDEYPPGINPLNGLPVAEPQSLALPPALVSISNSPVTARPQAGLSFSPWVFEMYIGIGVSRFLALFYGDYPTLGEDSSLLQVTPQPETAVVGPIRSGRRPYESLRKLYYGFLVIGSGSQRVLPYLSEYTNVFNDQPEDINGILVKTSRLEELARENLPDVGKPALSGLLFSQTPPPGGQKGRMIWLPYHLSDQIIWRYDPPSGAYHRYQDNGDAETFIRATDRLNGEPLTFENVVILFADYDRYDETLFDIDLLYILRMPALLFRDGKMYTIYWTTGNAEYEKKTGRLRPIRFIDVQGNPFALKHGQTWVEIVPLYTPYNETIDSEDYRQLASKQQPGSGVWAVHFSPPPFED